MENDFQDNDLIDYVRKEIIKKLDQTNYLDNYFIVYIKNEITKNFSSKSIINHFSAIKEDMVQLCWEEFNLQNKKNFIILTQRNNLIIISLTLLRKMYSSTTR